MGVNPAFWDAPETPDRNRTDQFSLSERQAPLKDALAPSPGSRAPPMPVDSPSLTTQLAKNNATVGLHPLIGEPAIVVIAESIGQFEGHPLTIRRQRPDRRVDPQYP